MAFAAVLFTLPLAFAAALTTVGIHGYGLGEITFFYVIVGMGVMAAFLTAASVAQAIDRP